MERTRSPIAPVHIYLLLILILSVLLGYFCVWTHDDFCTITESVGAMLEDSIFYGNGRYLGNFIVNLCLSHKPLDAAVRGIIITGIVALTASVPAELNCKTVSLSFASFFGFGNLIFREAVIWGHGFYNYVPPIFLCLIALQILKSYYISGKMRSKAFKTAILAILGVCQQLFSENATCIILFIATILFVAALRAGKPKGMAMSYLIGTSVGTFLMFALPAIMGVSYKMIGYRGVGLDTASLSAFVSMFYRRLDICLGSLLPMFPMWIVVSYALIRITRSYAGSSRAFRKLKPLFLVVFALQPVCSVVFFFISETYIKDRIPLTSIHIPGLNSKIRVALFVLFCVYLICAAFVLLRDELLRGDRRAYAVLIFLFAASVGELLVVTPLGSRCLFLPACILAVLSVRFVHGEELLTNGQAVASAICGVVYAVCLIVMMHSVSLVHEVKMAYARQQLAEGKKVIEIIRLPHSRWLMVPDETYAHGWYFNYGEKKPLEDYTYITYEDYLAKTENSPDRK